MEISKSELQAIIKTLPIGLYIKRGLSVAVGDESTSYYSPHTDEIVVSFPQIQTSLAKTPENSPHRERIIRGILYHEVSHAFITPTKLDWNDIVNVFEDERMETLLANYYYDVDFKTNVFLFNGFDVGKVPPATDKFIAFYNLVRFRSGDPTLLKRVEDIITRYADLSRNAEYRKCYDYYDEIMDLYRDTKEPTTPEKKEGDGEDGNLKFEGDIQGGSAEGSTTDSANEGDGAVQANDGVGRSSSSPLSAEEIHKMLDSIVADKQTNELTTMFQAIIDNFNKRNKGGSSIGGYSGVLNPRNANRPDYKIFDRPFSQKSDNQYGTCHLNLFIDKSGSFYYSEELVNKLLVALSAVERHSPNFTLDVVFCGNGEKLIEKKKDRVIRCGGGNDLDDNIYEIYRKLQKSGTCNYNIALFDGDAFSDAPRTHRKNFRAFDFNNCTIISDEENRRYIESNVHKAKVIYTSDYTKELLENIKTTLMRAFR
jgi:hypothetical protein